MNLSWVTTAASCIPDSILYETFSQLWTIPHLGSSMGSTILDRLDQVSHLRTVLQGVIFMAGNYEGKELTSCGARCVIDTETGLGVGSWGHKTSISQVDPPGALSGIVHATKLICQLLIPAGQWKLWPLYMLANQLWSVKVSWPDMLPIFSRSQGFSWGSPRQCPWTHPYTNSMS